MMSGNCGSRNGPGAIARSGSRASNPRACSTPPAPAGRSARSARPRAAMAIGCPGYWRAASCDPDLRPAERVTRERVAAYVAELRAERRGYTPLNRIQELLDALRVLAPDEDWSWLAQVYRNLRSTAQPSRDKTSRLKPIEELAALGERVMDEAETAHDWSARRRAVQYRDGLIVALLAYRPVRIKNLASMQLGQHLKKISGNWWILFAAEETKSHRPYEAFRPGGAGVAPATLPRMHRPSSCAAKAAAQKPTSTRFGFPKSEPNWRPGRWRGGSSITPRPSSGRIPPHWFRDAAATSIAVENPRHVGDAHLILGHAGLKRRKSITTTRKACKRRDGTRRFWRGCALRSTPEIAPAKSVEEPIHARRHLRPLFLGPAARSLDRGPDPPVQGENRQGGLDAGPGLPDRR